MNSKNNKKKRREKDKDKIRVKRGKNSSINEFIKRPLPTDKEVGKFEDYIYDKMEESNKQGSQLFNDEEREEEIRNSLSEIYKDSKGNQVNVKKMDIKKKRGLIFWFFFLIFLFFALIGAGLSGYYYVYNTGTDLEDVKITVEGKEKIYANEEFTYIIECHNNSRVALQDVRVSAEYPENFIFLDSSLSPERNNNNWNIPEIAPHSSEKIKVKGKIVGQKDSSNVLLATMHYMPANFSSEFKKESSFSSNIESIGLRTAWDYPESVLVGEKASIQLEITPEDTNHIQEFKLKSEIPENFEILDADIESSESDSQPRFEELDRGIWRFKEMQEGTHTFNFDFKVKNKSSSTEELTFNFLQEEEGSEFNFLQENMTMEVMESDLDLDLIIEGSQKDQPVDFGQKLNYTLTFANRGNSVMDDVTLMAVLESELLDWTTLEMETDGTEQGHSIIWDKEQLPALEELKPGEEGSIDFTINVLPFRESMLNEDNDFQIESYAQFNIGSDSSGTETSEEDVDNTSNTIINKINSDLDLETEARYFNQDNLPVGTGPLPPQVGERTTFKVYWTVTNNLHELRDTQVTIKLPEHVEWDGKTRTSAGDVEYNEDEHTIIWKIGKMPLTVYRADAQFSIALMPEEEDRNKILVLLPETVVQAEDQQTQAELKRRTGPITTKLEDDEVANMSNDGRVE